MTKRAEKATRGAATRQGEDVAHLGTTCMWRTPLVRLFGEEVHASWIRVVTGVATSPLTVWADASNKFFGLALGLAWLAEAHAGEQAKIEDAQAKAMAAQAPQLLKTLTKVPAGPVAFTGVRLFDADGVRFVNDRRWSWTEASSRRSVRRLPFACRQARS